MDRDDSKEVLKVSCNMLHLSTTRPTTRTKNYINWHDTYLVRRYGLRPPNIDGKPVFGVDDLLALQTFNIVYDVGVFPNERHRLNLSGSIRFSLARVHAQRKLWIMKRTSPKTGHTKNSGAAVRTHRMNTSNCRQWQTKM